jgi:hypothetical protein
VTPHRSCVGAHARACAGWCERSTAGYTVAVDRFGKVARAVGHVIAAIAVGLLDLGETPWLRKKVEKENDQIGRLI